MFQKKRSDVIGLATDRLNTCLRKKILDFLPVEGQHIIDTMLTDSLDGKEKAIVFESQGPFYGKM